MDIEGTARLAANSSRGRGPLADKLLANHLGANDQVDGIELLAATGPEMDRREVDRPT